LGVWLAIGLVTLGPISTALGDSTWINDFGGDWNTGSNWLGGSKPSGTVGYLEFNCPPFGSVTISDANDNLTGVSTLQLNGNGALAIQGSGSVTFASGGLITATSGILQELDLNVVATGSGLTVANYSRSFATLAIGSLGGGNTISLPEGATLTVENRSLVQIFSSISGDGSVVKNEPGSFFLYGNNTYTGGTTINVGSVHILSAHALPSTGVTTIASGAELIIEPYATHDTSATVGAIAGEGLFELLNNSGGRMSTTVNCDSDATFSGTLRAIMDNDLIKTGTGTWTFSGNTEIVAGSSLTAAVNQGLLNVNGNMACPVTVNSGGWLSGTGTVGNLTVNSGGGVAPGNSIGTLTVNGNYTHNAGATYTAEINDRDQSDQIHTTGTATINGGTVDVRAESGTYSVGKTYRILQADGGVSGMFDRVTDNLPLLNSQLRYGDNYIDLLLVHLPYVGVAQTRNQLAVATYLDALYPTASGDLATVMEALDLSSAPVARAAFEQLGGEPYADLASIDIAASNLFADTAFYRMMTIDGLVCGERTGRELWAYGLGNWQRQTSDDSYHGYTNDVSGFMIGADEQFDDTLIGFGAGYGMARNTFSALPDSVRTRVCNFSFYGKRDFDAAYVRGGVGYTHGWNDVARLIQFDSLAARQATGDASGNLLNTRVEAGYNFYHNAWKLTPLAGLRYVYASMPSTTETGAGSVNLAVDEYSQYSLASAVGARLAFCVTQRWRAEPYAQWEHEFGDTASVVAMSFADSPSGFTINGVGFGRDAARTGVLLIGNLSERVAANFNYEALLRASYTGQQCAGGLSFNY
jgi:outer membrane autotransporter protein